MSGSYPINENPLLRNRQSVGWSRRSCPNPSAEETGRQLPTQNRRHSDSSPPESRGLVSAFLSQGKDLGGLAATTARRATPRGAATSLNPPNAPETPRMECNHSRSTTGFRCVWRARPRRPQLACFNQSSNRGRSSWVKARQDQWKVSFSFRRIVNSSKHFTPILAHTSGI